MTHLRHDVTLSAPPREWADAVLDAVVAEVEAAHFDDQRRLAEPGLAAADVRLVEGTHLAPGCRYRAGPDGDEITVDEWSPQTRIAFHVADERPVATASTKVEVLPGMRSRVASLSGVLQVAGPFPKLRRVSWDGRVDLDRWWAGQPGAIEATVEHRWVRARVSAQVTTAGERWTVRCEARGRGRSWGRLMLGVVMLIWHGALVREYRRTLDEAARGWDRALAHWRDAPPPEAARALLAALVTALVEPVSTES